MIRRAPVQALCERAIRERVFPGCQIGWLEGDKIEVAGHGRLRYDDQATVTEETLYDIASVTKSLPTNSIILKLIDDGRLSLDDQAIRYLPELRNEYREQILIRHLLTYTVVFDLPGGMSGVAAEAPSRLLHSIFTAPLLAPPGERFYYTNAPAVLLGIIAEKVVNQPLDKIAREMFFEPLEMRRTSFRPRQDISQIAPSERVRGDDVVGIPHDEGARLLRTQGIVAGNAGVFSSAGDLLKYARMLLAGGTWDGRRYFSGKMVEAMHTNQISGLGEQVGLGWEMSQALVPDGVGSKIVFGKTGFTGCAMVIDPERDAAFVYLSNRNYPARAESREAIKAFRHELARLLLPD